MSARVTEQLHELSGGLDARPAMEIAAVLVEGQVKAAGVCRSALQAICQGGQVMAEVIRAGGVLHYVAAGSSGLMAAADAMELGGTYSIPARQVQIHMAGGIPTTAEMPGDTEDEVDGLTRALSNLTPKDVVIAVSASGRTPYTLEAVRIARRVGTKVVAIANNADAPLLEESNVAVLLETPPEVISGSTRMGAATAQKITLNAMSTLMAIELGHVHDGMMVNLRVENSKLQDRAIRMVSAISGVAAQAADANLQEANGQVKHAVLLSAGASDLAHASQLLDEHDGKLRGALEALNDKT